MRIALRIAYVVALALAWLGYFSAWLWPVPAALRLSAHDLVEWMTFVQGVRDGTYPVTRLDLLWPLSGIALLTALSIAFFQVRSHSSNPFHFSVFFRPINPGCLALALFGAGLILPAYPFLLTAYRDPELAPQFWLGVASAIAGILASIFALVRPGWALVVCPFVCLFSLVTAIHAGLLIRQPIADALARPAPVGYGFVLTVVGLGVLMLLSGGEAVHRLLSRSR